MSNAPFVKLYGDKLLRSTLWLEKPEVRLTFLGMLALANWEGFVEAPSVRVLAHTLNLPVDYVQSALDVLEAPDPESRTPDHEGRRALRVDGGWQLVNYAKYRETRTPKQVADADRQRRHREGEPKPKPKCVTKRDTSRSSQPVATDLRSKNLDPRFEIKEEEAAAALSPSVPSQQEQEGQQEGGSPADASVPIRPLSTSEVAYAWNSAAAKNDLRFQHAARDWQDAFATIAAAMETEPPEAQRQALQVVCDWFWTAPDGPACRDNNPVAPHALTPALMAARVCSDREAARDWHAGKRSQRREMRGLSSMPLPDLPAPTDCMSPAEVAEVYEAYKNRKRSAALADGTNEIDRSEVTT